MFATTIYNAMLGALVLASAPPVAMASDRPATLDIEGACRLDAAACRWDTRRKRCRTVYYPSPGGGHYTVPTDYRNSCRILPATIKRGYVPEGAFKGCDRNDLHCKIIVAAKPEDQCNGSDQRSIYVSACLRPGDRMPKDSVCCLSKVRV